MAQFRKKPVVIEAERVFLLLAYAAQNWKALPDWLRSAYDAGDIVFASDAIHIRTLEGTMQAGRTDWIIRGVKGELYPCKDDIFRETYETLEGGSLKIPDL